MSQRVLITELAREECVRAGFPDTLTQNDFEEVRDIGQGAFGVVWSFL